MTALAAIDLGATSGRVMLADVDERRLELREVARFANGPVRRDDGLHWDVDALRDAAFAGLGEATRQADVASVGIDSWAVDYGLLRGGAPGGELVGEPFHYRDSRSARGQAAVEAIVPAAELFARNGLQRIPLTTVNQLMADVRLGEAEGLLLIPDLLAFWLTGVAVGERTNASTTGLLSLDGTWDVELAATLGLPAELLPRLVDPGTVLGPIVPSMREALGIAGSPEVVAVGSHDTASAVVAVPMLGDAAYISSGTWSLVGVETDSPVTTEAARAANFTNEGGVDGRTRFLKNVMGQWLLNESLRTWAANGEPVSRDALLEAAAQVTAAVPVFDATDEVFTDPGDMPTRIVEWCVGRGIRPPQSKAEIARSILESLASAYAETIASASELSGVTIGSVHIVGGGSQNGLLCQLTADRTGLPVHAGPVEATAIGNVLVQARAMGVLRGSLESLRALVMATHPPVTYAPSGRHSTNGAS